MFSLNLNTEAVTVTLNIPEKLGVCSICFGLSEVILPIQLLSVASIFTAHLVTAVLVSFYGIHKPKIALHFLDVAPS